MAVKVLDDSAEYSADDLPEGDVTNGVTDGQIIEPFVADPDDNWVAAILETGETEAIREALSESQSKEARAFKKWSKTVDKYGAKIRDDLEAYQRWHARTNRLFLAATRGLA